MAMTRDEIIEAMNAYVPTEDRQEGWDSLVGYIVDDAIEEVRNTRYPRGYHDAEDLRDQTNAVLLRYPSVIRRIAEYHIDKIGKEGATTFYEAGQTTSFEAGGTPPSFLASVIPIATIV